MSGLNEACGIQVVKVKDDHTYKLDEAALKEILLREDVKDLPVVVVSVAGAYRGGKSFLLDLFIKYLSAPESFRNSDKWLGDENEPLGGFHWRGGCDRETTGLHLWSEPIKINYKGKTVVVLLMDTQGTFDSNSTVRDCSTIFALSTLISSVQIYNLKENIKEDDLQHLHLFVEYGKLAHEQEDTAFQVLMFLVRDWPYPYQHPYGAVGGEQLLAKRLEINASHTEDMRSLRKCIRTFFESVKAFLMPHPGFSVSEIEFDGRLSSIREEFKNSLLDLVPSIFGPDNLTPKKINGSVVKCSDLFYYFQTYMAIFNSNELPEPVTIMKATSEAALMAAEREACEVYSRMMEESCGAHQPSVSSEHLRSAHKNALEHAHQAFTARKKMGQQKDIDNCLDRIMKDLEDRLSSYEALNDAKLKSAIANANQAYDDTIQKMCGNAVLCLHPTDLDVLHLKAITNATECFDLLYTSSDDDEERFLILEKLEGKINELRNKNDQNNLGFVMKGQEEYVRYIANSTTAGSFFSESLLKQRHTEAMEIALQSFTSRRNMDNDEAEDPYIEMLKRMINEEYNKNTLINRNANRTAVQAALHAYNDHMTKMWGPEVYCLHPDDLCSLNQDATNAALEEFMSNRTAEEDDAEDVDRKKLIEKLERRYGELRDINEGNNNRAVDEAYNHYSRKMESKCKPSILSIFVVPWVVKVLKQFPEFHESAKSEAIDVFKSRRRQLRSHSSDRHLSRLTDVSAVNDNSRLVSREFGREYVNYPATKRSKLTKSDIIQISVCKPTANQIQRHTQQKLQSPSKFQKLNNGYDQHCNPLKALGREFSLPL